LLRRSVIKLASMSAKPMYSPCGLKISAYPALWYSSDATACRVIPNPAKNATTDASLPSFTRYPSDNTFSGFIFPRAFSAVQSSGTNNDNTAFATSGLAPLDFVPSGKVISVSHSFGKSAKKSL